MTWSSGYVTDVGYVYSYYVELNPLLLRLACLHAGVAPPAGTSLNYLELGFGQGVSLNVHAATLPGRFWGNDFNPGHAGYARGLAATAGSDATISDDSFAELLARDDLPEFDIIALHGVWSWVSDDNRRTIVDLIQRKLRVGGLVYVSYNCRPGWAAAEPLRHLMILHSELAGSEAAGRLANVDRALAYCQQVIDAGSLYFSANPLVKERLQKIMAQNRNYVAHEYFNRDWAPMSFSRIVEMLEPAKLTFAASAHLLDHVDSLNLSDAGRQLLAATTHPVLRESVRDYLVNQQFRRDIFIKGPLRLSRFDQIALLKATRIVLTTAAADVPMKVTGALAEAVLQAELYRPLVDALAADGYAPKTLGDLATTLALDGEKFPVLVQAILVLVGGGNALPAQVPTAEARRRSAALNRHLCERARADGEVLYLASPVTASGVFTPRLHQLLLLARGHGRTAAADQVAFVWQILSSQGQQVHKDGKVLQTEAEAVAELRLQAEIFASKRLPVLEALEVALDTAVDPAAT